MRVFVGWWAIQNESFMKHNAVIAVVKGAGLFSNAQTLLKELNKLPRKNRLEFGLLSLQRAKRQT
jgi:hypothetical protein